MKNKNLTKYQSIRLHHHRFIMNVELNNPDAKLTFFNAFIIKCF